MILCSQLTKHEARPAAPAAVKHEHETERYLWEGERCLKHSEQLVWPELRTIPN